MLICRASRKQWNLWGRGCDRVSVTEMLSSSLLKGGNRIMLSGTALTMPSVTNKQRTTNRDCSHLVREVVLQEQGLCQVF